MKVLKIKHDSSPINPFDDFDGLFPTITENNDYSNGEIDSYLQSYLSYNQIILHQKRLCKMMDMNYLELCKDYLESRERINSIIDSLVDFISESMKNKVKFCNEFGIKYFYQLSRGYSQGDASWVFICWTPEFEEVTGLSYNKVTESDMESTFKLYGYWAWGDVYGFELIEQTTCPHCNETHEKEIDSCWGFYGTDHFENGLVDHIRHHFDEMDENQFKDMIESIEVEYSNCY
jgi:hypothetical protein